MYKISEARGMSLQELKEIQFSFNGRVEESQFYKGMWERVARIEEMKKHLSIWHKLIKDLHLMKARSIFFFLIVFTLSAPSG